MNVNVNVRGNEIGNVIVMVAVAEALAVEEAAEAEVEAAVEHVQQPAAAIVAIDAPPAESAMRIAVEPVPQRQNVVAAAHQMRRAIPSRASRAIGPQRAPPVAVASW